VEGLEMNPDVEKTPPGAALAPLRMAKTVAVANAKEWKEIMLSCKNVDS
jgi:hypothetical protein